MSIIKLPEFTVKKVISALSQVEGWGIKQLSVPEAWKITQGEDITVMVIDTGYTDHPDLETAIDKNKCKSCLSYETNIDDGNGHSSHCVGIIGARNNDQGMVGVAPKCNIITVKALDKDGSGDVDSIIAALKYAIQIKPDVVSMSLGAPIDIPGMHDLIKELYKMNIPIVCAAGNSGAGTDTVNYPGKYEEVIAVAAYDKNGNIANFSSTGTAVDITAPGVNIYSTWLNKEYASISGTSMACPFIAGVVALLLAKHRNQEKITGQNDCKTVDQVKEHLYKYTTDKGTIGKDNIWGYGVIDPVKVITELSNTKPKVIPQKKSWWKKFLNFFGIG